jgi:hypothetical protein
MRVIDYAWVRLGINYSEASKKSFFYSFNLLR